MSPPGRAVAVPSKWRWLSVEPRQPAWVREHRAVHWLVVGSVCIGAFMGQLDASIVTLATPALQRHFQVSLGAASWVALSYLLVLVATVVPIGRLADAVGRKMLYVYGFAVAAAFPTSTVVLLVALVLVGAGSGLFTPANNATIMTSAPAHRASVAGGVLNMTRAFGTALGVAVSSLVYALFGAGSSGYRAALASLAALAVGAAALAASNRVGESDDSTAVTLGASRSLHAGP